MTQHDLDNPEYLASLSTWVLSILRNKIIDAFRERRRAAAVPAEAAEAADAADAADRAVAGYFDGRGQWDGDTRPADWGDPVMAFESSRFWEVFEACLYRLPENTARVFLMREVIGFETPEICRTLAVTANNCWVLLHRARLQLRACLGEKWFGEGAAA